MRALFIGSGVYLLDRFHWLAYPFAVLILLASARLLFGEKQERQAVAAACAVCGSWVARWLPITPVIRGGNFWIRQNGRRLATPLLIALIVIETSDIVFSLDSIPAVLAVTREPFLVYTSNIFAMLGLRSLYLLLAGAVERFHSLRYALGAILAFVGGKMLLTDVLEIPNWSSLLVVIAAVLVALAASALERRTASLA
jgi:tellurite resistance protein TerC